MKVLDNNQTVKPLSQIDLANGWKLVVPHKINTTVNSIDDKGNNIIKVTSNIVHCKINLAQLPRYLWSQWRNQFITNQKTNIKVVDKSHYYYIEPTSIDREIALLVDILDEPYKVVYKEQVNQLLNVLKENDIHGWCVIKAQNMYL